MDWPISAGTSLVLHKSGFTENYVQLTSDIWVSLSGRKLVPFINFFLCCESHDGFEFLNHWFGDVDGQFVDVAESSCVSSKST
jgi:hypothetical protein